MFDECGVHSYPIDPFEIARTLCYIVRPYSGLSAAEQEAAFEERDEGYSKLEFFPDLGFRYVIYYNDMVLSEGRIRWTLFHEIAHCYLGHHEHPDNSLYIIEEQEANLFTKNAILLTASSLERTPSLVLRRSRSARCLILVDALI